MTQTEMTRQIINRLLICTQKGIIKWEQDKDEYGLFKYQFILDGCHFIVHATPERDGNLTVFGEFTWLLTSQQWPEIQDLIAAVSSSKLNERITDYVKNVHQLVYTKISDPNP